MEPQEARNRVAGIHNDRRSDSKPSSDFTLVIDKDDPDKGMFDYSRVRRDNALSAMRSVGGTPYAYGLQYGHTQGWQLSGLSRPPQTSHYDE